MEDNRYPIIAGQGLSGDLQTAVLVTGTATIGWSCWPRFDVPAGR
ncbi:MAG: hypothetical protein ACR2FU_10000 [Streptosporangiaceae bacterium]